MYINENPVTHSKAPCNETNGMFNGEVVYCPVNAYGDCPYCDQCNVCHMYDPITNCDDFAASFESWEEWERL